MITNSVPARLAGACAATLALTSCTVSSADSSSFVIAYQQGLGSGVLMTVETSDCMAKAAPGHSVEFKQFNSGAAIRDSMLAGEVDVGGVGSTPFLVGYQRGVDWKILSAQNEMEFRLMVADPEIDSLADLEASGQQIAVPGADSPQTMVLQKAAEQQLGDPNALRTRLVFMAHPDAMQALLTGQIGAHMSSAPFTYQEQQDGARSLLDSNDVFDVPINNTVIAVSDNATETQTNTVNALSKCIDQARNLLRNHQAQAATYLSQASDGQESAHSIQSHLAHNDLRWPTTARGMTALAEYMDHLDLIDAPPSNPDNMRYSGSEGQ